MIAWISSALIADDKPPGMVYEAEMIANTIIIICKSASGSINFIIKAAA